MDNSITNPVYWGIDEEYNLFISSKPCNKENLKFSGSFDPSNERFPWYNVSKSPPWWDMKEDIKSVEVTDCVVFETVENYFDSMVNCETMDLHRLDTSNLTDMSSMFSSCINLKSLDLSGDFNTSKVIDMAGMFGQCRSLKKLDVSHFDTSNVTNMWGMFDQCSSLLELDASNFNTAQVTNMDRMFANCKALKHLDLSGFTNSKLVTLNSMFENCTNLRTLNLNRFGPRKKIEINNIFKGCKHLRIENLKTRNSDLILNLYDIKQRDKDRRDR